MERPHRPPPLTIPPPPRPRTRVRRPRRHNHRQVRQFRRWLLRAQIANDVAHGAAACILLWIMSWFLYNVPFPLSYRTGPAAIAIIAALSADVLLDARSIVHAHDPFPGWALLLRLLIGAGLIAVFWVYIALGDVFAPGFSYWGMSDTYGRVLAYMFLWGVGLWDLLFVALCRHWLGKELRRYRTAVAEMLARRRDPGPSAHRLDSSTGGPEGGFAAPGADVEAAGPVTEEHVVTLPARMGVRRAVKSSSVSASVASTSTSASGSASPPLAVMRPA
ncbi:hypothetical protein CPLU01_04161 [Colletotrichum plurivorum]|uniref:Uncharacterized protein n=1 Tax=Colletotrichum plurivorum TaxID=2175906 RepID=A0A8H6KRN5_9PEZI|nr:hypothetical protein CPLU01_04161 [Colletotrichum plurivorum]